MNSILLQDSDSDFEVFELFDPAATVYANVSCTFLVHLLMHFLYCNEPLINCCPICGEIIEVSDKLNTLVHLSLCFDEGTGNQVMTGGFLTDKQASYGWMFKPSEWAHFSSYDVGLNSGSSASHILVVTAPMSSINAIAVEAFKKYILVSLIQNRQFSTSLPKYASLTAQRNLKTLCQPNMEVASSYSGGKVSELEIYIQTNMGEIMTLSKKLTVVDELLSCDPLYLAKAGRKRQRFDFDDFDPVSHKFNI
nr:COP9 signalosome complex subunit 3-like [Populus alba]